MLNEKSKLIILVFLLASATSGFAVFYITYRRYYKYLKKTHHDKWWQLMSKDPMVDAVGEWVRWPGGSIYLFFSVFKISETLNDEKIGRYKKTSTVAFVFFFVFFILLLFVSMILPAI